MILKLRPMHRYAILAIAIAMTGLLAGCPEVPFPTTSGPLASVGVSTNNVVIGSAETRGTVYVFNGGAPLNALLWTASSPQDWIAIEPPTGLSYGPADGDLVSILASGGGRDLAPGGSVFGQVVFSPVGALSPPVTVNVEAQSDDGIFAGSNVGKGVAGDFNGDGAVDFAALNTVAGGIDVFLTATAKQMAGDQFIPVTDPLDPMKGLALADLNFDGISDLVTVNLVTDRDATPQTQSSDLIIVPGSASGVFGAAIRLSLSAAGEDVEAFGIADFDIDGRLDVMAATFDSALSSVTIVEINPTGGAPIAAGAGAVIGFPTVIAVGDLVGDSRPDTAFVSIASQVVAIYETSTPNDPTETNSFVSSNLNVPLGTSPLALAVTDVTGNGSRDLVGAGLGTVAVAENLGDGTFASPVMTPTCTVPQAIALGDFTGDGLMDIAVGCSSGTVEILIGQGTGQFTQGQSIVFGFSVSALRSTDWNGDGNVDLVGGDNAGMMAVVLGDGTGNFN